jgi:hypothetical protein
MFFKYSADDIDAVPFFTAKFGTFAPCDNFQAAQFRKR